jgi:hypothetical protein
MLRSALAALWLIMPMLPVRAATLERLSLDEMVEKSTAIVRGRVVGSQTSFRASVVYTTYKVQVTERWKGADQPFVDVTLPGGATGNVRQSFPGVPSLQAEKEYVLFLWTGKSGITHIIGLTQGLFELPKGSDTVIRNAATEIMLDPNTGSPVKDERLQMRLGELRSRVAVRLSLGVTK